MERPPGTAQFHPRRKPQGATALAKAMAGKTPQPTDSASSNMGVVVQDAASKHLSSKDVLPYDLNDEDQLDLVPGAGTPSKVVGSVPLWKRVFWDGGRPADAFLTVVSAQVGQVILNLPNSMAKAGLPLGITFQVLAATVSLYTLWLLSILYQEYKRASVKDDSWFNDKEKGRRTRVTQFHEVIHGVTGLVWLGRFAWFVTMLEMVGLCVAQTIAGSSNLYSLQPVLPKRTWALIFGAFIMQMIWIPSMRNMRPWSLLALFSTTYTSLFMVATSLSHGLDPAAARLPPRSPVDVFACLANVVFAYGGNAMLMEVIDSQWRPSKFTQAFAWSQLYTSSVLTLPNAIFTFLAFPALSLKFSNAFAIYPPSTARSVGIVTMVLDQLTAYGLFVHPLLITWEKALQVHHKPWYIRLPARLPVGLLIYFIALAVPFFGVINDLMGAFCVTFETFILAPLAFNLYYQRRPDRQAVAFFNPRWLGWTGVFVFNWIVVGTTLVAGLGAGGYASVTNLIKAVNTFGLFAKCYQC